MADTNKVKYGLRNLYYSVITKEGSTITYAIPKKWQGAVSLSTDPKGETSSFRADDTDYFVSNSNEGYEGTLEVAKIPDEVLKDVYSYVETEDGILLEDANALPKEVALLFEFQGDVNATRQILYDVVLGRGKEEFKTTDGGIEPTTTSIDFTSIPVTNEAGDEVYVKGKCGKTDTAYSTFYTAAPKFPKKKSQ